MLPSNPVMQMCMGKTFCRSIPSKGCDPCIFHACITILTFTITLIKYTLIDKIL